MMSCRAVSWVCVPLVLPRDLAVSYTVADIAGTFHVSRKTLYRKSRHHPAVKS